MATKPETKPEINVTPLIDVLLVLLIIFMVISPLKPSKFEAKVPSEPKNDSIKVEANPLTLVVSVNADMSLQLNGEINMGTIAEPGALVLKLTEVFRERKEKRTIAYEKEFAVGLSEDEKIERTVMVKAPRSIKYGEIVKLIDAIKGTGAQPIGLQIDDLQN